MLITNLIWLLVLCVVFAMAWLVARRLNNLGLVDVVWTASVGLTAVYHALLGTADSWQILITTGLVLLWSLRLLIYLVPRYLSTEEDPRYTWLQGQYGEQEAVRTFVVFQFQALTVWVLGLAIDVATDNTEVIPTVSILAVVFGFLAILGEAVSDFQLARFKKQHKGSAAVCNQGLWRYSRHPNYFFEWMFWMSIPILAWASWGFLIALMAPFMMYLLLHQVTGIPYAERQSLISRGDAYADYQRTTSAFFPWFPKKQTQE